MIKRKNFWKTIDYSLSSEKNNILIKYNIIKKNTTIKILVKEALPSYIALKITPINISANIPIIEIYIYYFFKNNYKKGPPTRLTHSFEYVPKQLKIGQGDHFCCLGLKRHASV